MSWARLDDTIASHHKFLGLDMAAVGLWTMTLAWAHQQRVKRLGYLPAAAPLQFVNARQLQKLAPELVGRGLWTVAPEGGWDIHDFTEYLSPNDDGMTASERAQARREKSQKAARKRWDRKATADAEALQEQCQDDAQAHARAHARALPEHVPEDCDGNAKAMPPSRPVPSLPPQPPRATPPDLLTAADVLGGNTLDEDDAAWAVRIVTAARTDWHPIMVRQALDQAAADPRSPRPAVAVAALLAVSRDPDTRSVKRLHENGPWWTEAQAYAERPVSAPIADHQAGRPAAAREVIPQW